MSYYNFEICDYFMSTLPTIESIDDAERMAKKLPVYKEFEDMDDINGIAFWDGDVLYRVVRTHMDEFLIDISNKGYYGDDVKTQAEMTQWIFDNKDAVNAAIKVSAEDGYLDGEEF